MDLLKKENIDNMYQGNIPYQFAKECLEEDYLFVIGNRYFVQSKYAGKMEIDEQEFQRLENKGLRIKI